MNPDNSVRPPFCAAHNKFHILGPNCVGVKEVVVDEDEPVIDEAEIRTKLADLTINWSHAVQEAVKREAKWQSNGGPLRKQASELEQQIHSLIFYHNLHPREDASDEVETTTGESAV